MCLRRRGSWAGQPGLTRSHSRSINDETSDCKATVFFERRDGMLPDATNTLSPLGGRMNQTCKRPLQLLKTERGPSSISSTVGLLGQTATRLNAVWAKRSLSKFGLKRPHFARWRDGPYLRIEVLIL